MKCHTHVLARNVVERHRVSVAVAGGRNLLLGLGRRCRVCKLPCRQQRASRAGPRGMGVRPDRILPAGDAAIIDQRGANLALHGRPYGSNVCSCSRVHWTRIGIPGDRARDHRRIRRCIVRAVMAIAAGPLDVDAAHLLGRQAEHFRDSGSIRIDALVCGSKSSALPRLRRATAHDGPIEPWI